MDPSWWAAKPCFTLLQPELPGCTTSSCEFTPSRAIRWDAQSQMCRCAIGLLATSKIWWPTTLVVDDNHPPIWDQTMKLPQYQLVDVDSFCFPLVSWFWLMAELTAMDHFLQPIPHCLQDGCRSRTCALDNQLAMTQGFGQKISEWRLETGNYKDSPNLAVGISWNYKGSSFLTSHAGTSRLTASHSTNSSTKLERCWVINASRRGSPSRDSKGDQKVRNTWRVSGTKMQLQAMPKCVICKPLWYRITIILWAIDQQDMSD